MSNMEKLLIASQFLAHEARLLDEGREEEWFQLLDDELLYLVPLRQSAETRERELPPGAFRVREGKEHIRVRIDRLKTGHAYAEQPASRTLRLVGSVEIQECAEPAVIAVSSALLLYRQRGLDPHFDLIPVRRNDRLRLTAGGPRLLRREAILTETALGTPNLGVFL